MSQNFTGSQQTFLDTMETTQTEIGQYDVQWMSRAETRINKINYQDLFLKQLLDQFYFILKGAVLVLYYTNSRMHIHTLTQHALSPHPNFLQFSPVSFLFSSLFS